MHNPNPSPGSSSGAGSRSRDGRRLFALGCLVGAGGATLAAGLLLLLRPHAPTGNSAPPFTRSPQEIALAKGTPQPIPFETEPVQLGQALSLPPVTARIAALEVNTAPSYAPLDSRIDHVVVKLGETVAAGARLALLRSGDLASMLRDLRASSALAQTKRALAARMQVLVEARGASSNDLLVARNDLRDAELQARTAESRLKSLSIEPDGDNLYWLLAARAGVVTQLEATPGQQVGPSRDRPVVTLADLDTVLVLADVPQQDASALHIGDPVDIRILGDNDSIGSGVIENISQVVDPERQTLPIRIRAANPEHRLRPNAFVEAHFGAGPAAPRTMLLVPTEAVVSDGLESVVFVQTEPGRFHRTEVTVGRQRGKRTEIRAGLKPGDRIVTRGALLLLNALDLED